MTRAVRLDRIWRRARAGVLAGTVAVVAALVLVGLLRDAPVAAVLDRLASLGPVPLIAAAAGWWGHYALRALRLRQEWAAQQAVPFARCLRLVLLHNAALLLLPLRSGEAGYVWLVHRQWGVSLAQAGRSLLWLRWQDSVVLAAFGLALLAPWPPVWRPLAGAAVLAAGMGLAPVAARLTARVWPRLRLPRVLGVVGAAGAAGDGRLDAVGWACSLATWALRLAVVAGLLTRLTGVEAIGAVRAALGGELGAALPLQGPAGLGNYELGLHWAARLDRPAASATALAELVAAGFAVHLFCLALALLAAALAQGLGQGLGPAVPRPARHPV